MYLRKYMFIKIFRHWAISSISKNPWAITSELLGNCPMAPPGYATGLNNKQSSSFYKCLKYLIKQPSCCEYKRKLSSREKSFLSFIFIRNLR
jgi:hypothetical protein